MELAVVVGTRPLVSLSSLCLHPVAVPHNPPLHGYGLCPGALGPLAGKQVTLSDNSVGLATSSTPW
jgi:hypothetical protein